MSDGSNNFIRKYLSENNGKLDSNFINQYLGTVAIIEYFICRAHPEIETERIRNIQNSYMHGIEDEDVSDCDFSSLTQEEFEMLRFNERTKFNIETINKFHPDEILKRENTKIKDLANNENMPHIAILDGPIINVADNNPNLIIKNYVDESIQATDSYHGRSVYSIFSSINPNCTVHFYGADPIYDEKTDEDVETDRLKALQDIIEYNNCTDDSKKIKLISCSHRLSPEENELITSNNINVISAKNLHGDFFEYFKFDDKNVVPTLTDEDKEYLHRNYSQYPDAVKMIENMDSIMNNAILMNTNLVIDQHYGNMKRHECDISVSWGVPVVAAYYSIALKADPNISYDKFYDICKKSLKEKTHIFDEDLFMKNIKEIQQEKTNFLPQEIGMATIDVPTEQKDESMNHVNYDVKMLESIEK